MRESKTKEVVSAKKLTKILEQILAVAPKEATETITLRHGYGLGDPGKFLGPKTSMQAGCVAVSKRVAKMTYIVPGHKKGPMIAMMVEWPSNHLGLYVLWTPSSFIKYILNERNAVLPERRDRLTDELIASFEKQLDGLRA